MISSTNSQNNKNDKFKTREEIQTVTLKAHKTYEYSMYNIIKILIVSISLLLTIYGVFIVKWTAISGRKSSMLKI